MSYFIVYKTTNLINNKIYIGIHKQEDLEFDGYLGSGLLLTRAIKKYGIENFKREILFHYKTLDESRRKEKELVTAEFCKQDTNYNISVGGTGGNTNAGKSEDEIAEIYRKIGSKTRGRKLEGAVLKKAQDNMRLIRVQPNNKGRKHSEETKLKYQLSNHMRGKRWVTDGVSNVAQLETDPIPDGWWLGRTIPDEQKFKGHTEENRKKVGESRHNKIWITDGVTSKLHPKELPVPEGWRLGLIRHKKDKRRFITDGINTLKILDTEELPDGWKYGRTLNRSKKGV